MALDANELPPFIGADVVDTTATAYATWMFEQQAGNENDEAAYLAIVQNAISAAYIAGCLDTASSEAAQPSQAFVGKSGATFNLYFN
jgi:hypothetical protein